MKNLLHPGLLLLLLTSSIIAASQVPKFNSLPGATAVIYLDFDGHTVKSTSWNYNGPIVCDPSGLDEPKITEIFNRVAEDYRPFNVNVTTDSTKFLAAPINRRMRVILTVSSGWYGNAGGVAFVGSFTWGDNSPCFVFTALLGSNPKNIAEATSHEAGHTLGLYHQSEYDPVCYKISDYYAGTGTGETSWAPIMGVGYYRNVTTWYNGPNSYGCTNYQSDLDIITTRNGFGYRSDDHSSSFSSASTLNFTNNQAVAGGMIERNIDADFFQFNLQNNYQLTLDAIPYSVGSNAGSNMDLKITLYDNRQAPIQTYNPPNLLSSRIDTLLNSGTYYLKVEASGNQYTPSYASLGSYSLQAALTTGTLPLHKLELRGSSIGENHQLTWDIIADEKITDLILEISTDGRNFTPLARTDNSARSYQYRPFTSNTPQYRLNVTFDNGRQYYSNIISLRTGLAVQRPQLIGNLVNHSTLTVSSPGNFVYSIHDLNGHIIKSGQLSTGINRINAPAMTSGIYLVRYTDKTQQWTDKLVRQ